jgi:protein phosphatase
MFDASVTTHIGLVRKQNEDSFAANKKLGLWVVADGVGGNAHGEYASQLIVKTIERKIGQGKSLVESVQSAHESVKKAALDNLKYSGMASTVVACHFKANQYEIAWVGDSRAYLIDQKGFHQLTRDHNRAQWLVEQGEITREQSWNHPAQSQLTHAIGIEETLHIDYLTGHLYGDELLMLCSDGLTGQLTDAQLWQTYQSSLEDVGGGELFLERLTESLVRRALETGGNDNISLALIRMDKNARNKFKKHRARLKELQGAQTDSFKKNLPFKDQETPIFQPTLFSEESSPTFIKKNMDQLIWLLMGMGVALIVVMLFILLR